MQAKDIMTTSVIVVDKEIDIFDIAKIMKENDIGFIPVSDKQKIIGVITDRDIVVKVLANKDTKIYNYISKDIITCNVDDNINTILTIMAESKVKRLLVVDDKKVVGIISLSDIINIDCSNQDKIISIQSIWSISKNDQSHNLEIDEFYL
ncbi:MAG: CBS domain-containing protein [Bacilli bacterium]